MDSICKVYKVRSKKQKTMTFLHKYFYVNRLILFDRFFDTKSILKLSNLSIQTTIKKFLFKNYLPWTIPAIVTDVSATLVENTTFLYPLGDGRNALSCSSLVKVPCIGTGNSFILKKIV